MPTALASATIPNISPSRMLDIIVAGYKDGVQAESFNLAGPASNPTSASAELEFYGITASASYSTSSETLVVDITSVPSVFGVPLISPAAVATQLQQLIAAVQ